MDDLRVDYALLRDRLDRLMDIAAMINEEIERISEYTGGLDIFWDGDANSAYICKIGEDLMEADMIMMHVRNTVNTAVNVFELYQDNEKEVKRMIGDYKL